MKRKNNILYIGNALSNKGATVTSIETLGKFLQEDGYSVKMTSSKTNKVLRLWDMGMTLFLNRKWADIVLIDTYSTTNYWYAVVISLLAQKLKIPYIPILRGGNLPDRIQRSKNTSRSLFGKSYINIAPSAYLMESFRAQGLDKLVYIPNTIQLKNYPFKKRESLSPSLLWVRSFSKIYNPLLALDVLQEVLKTYPEATLTMVGPEKDGSLEKCSAFAKANSLPVIFTGGLPKEEWITLAADYDIFMNTTNFDNTPVSVIEAMALGLPIVSTNVGGIPYLLEDGKDALLVNPRNTQEFSQAVLKILENRGLVEELVASARTKVETFDWETVKHKWHKVLSKEL